MDKTELKYKIFEACQDNDLEFLKSLKDIDYNFTDDNGKTTLDHAMIWGSARIIHYLKDSGAKTSLQIKYEQEYGKNGVLDYILEHKENIDLEILNTKINNSLDTCIIRMVKENDFARLKNEILIPNKISLNFNTVARLGDKRQNIITLLKQQGQLNELLDPKLWQKSYHSLKKTISSINPTLLKDLNISRILHQTRKQQIKTRSKKLKAFRKKP